MNWLVFIGNLPSNKFFNGRQLYFKNTDLVQIVDNFSRAFVAFVVEF